jgi:lipopolysaccharide export system protein LptA
LIIAWENPPVLSADKQGKSAGVPEKEKIHISSDRSVFDLESGFSEFIGNVKATQGASIITSDRLKVLFGKDSGQANNQVTSGTSIEKIVANGNVRIIFEKGVAVTQRAEYVTETGVYTLSGNGSKVTSGRNSITGAKITFRRADGRIAVESGRGKQVEAVFYPGEKGIK